MQGGLFDHIEGGFFRYCVDTEWSIPHYEKMLYNSAQLIEIYSLFFKFNSDIKIKDAICLTINWLKNKMQSRQGGFYSSLDADSINNEGVLEEGAYYNWNEEELKEKLNREDFEILSKWFFIGWSSKL